MVVCSLCLSRNEKSKERWKIWTKISLLSIYNCSFGWAGNCNVSFNIFYLPLLITILIMVWSQPTSLLSIHLLRNRFHNRNTVHIQNKIRIFKSRTGRVHFVITMTVETLFIFRLNMIFLLRTKRWNSFACQGFLRSICSSAFGFNPHLPKAVSAKVNEKVQPPVERRTWMKIITVDPDPWVQKPHRAFLIRLALSSHTELPSAKTRRHHSFTRK